MAYTRSTVIDATPSGDSVKQAVLDLDADLTGAFNGLNQLQAALALKINQSEFDQPGGVPRLDSSGKILAPQLPGTGADLPLGMIAAFGMETLPAATNWLECNGAELLIAEYQALYGVIGNAFGLGNAGYFKLPDLRGEFLRGWDHGRGKDPDAAARTRGDHVGSAQENALGAHSHPLDMGAQGVGEGGAWAYGDREAGQWGNPNPSPMNTTICQTVGGNETRPANTAVMYCIKWR